MEPKAQDTLAKRQAAGQKAHDEMLRVLVGYTPCGKLTVDDVLYIARTAQTLAFNAATDVVGAA